MLRKKAARAAVAAAVTIGVVAGVSAMARADETARHRVLTVTAHNYSFDIGANRSVSAGLVKLDLTNAGWADHMAMVLRLHDGVTPEQFVDTASQRGEGAALALVDFAGGAGPVHPGGEQITYQTLSAGNYLIVCLLPTPDGRTHLMLGMHSTFSVTGRRTGRTAPHRVAGTISAHNMTFTLPANFSGHGIYRFADTDSSDTHELTILKLAPGKHASDVAAWFRQPGPPPFSFEGGFGAIAPGSQGFARLDLAPGSYVATCFVPDDQPPHAPHGAMGMMVEFTIPRR